MRKSVLGMILLGGVLLAGCSCEHTWQEATCTAPKTCMECGETEGEAAAHKLSAATCTMPATCEMCGATEGEALPHDFLVATCAQPEVCSRCGEERGERLSHEEQFIGECDRCHEIQNRDVVETILSKLEDANGYVALIRDGMNSKLEALTGEEGYEERKDSTLKDMCIWTETQFYDMFEEPRDIYEEVERLYEEARELCGEYKELADLKEKLWTCIDYIPEEMSEVTVEKYEKYNILLSECDEELKKEAKLLMVNPVMTYALSFENLCDAIWGDAGCLKEMQSVGELVGIEVSEEQ